jgi:transcription initiation factor TFIIIB Brf1 subunit/transcription initiation factor TFIIB
MNNIQKTLEGWKNEREIDKYNENIQFIEGYVKAMCDAINLVKKLTITDVIDIIKCDDCGGELYYDETNKYYVCKECKTTQ